ncbi:MAG: hypothetical protein V3T23_06950 [Nitrososphaerales archaeon]
MAWASNWTAIEAGEGMYDPTLLFLDLIDATLERLPVATRFDASRTTLEALDDILKPADASIRPIEMYDIISYFDNGWLDLIFDSRGTNNLIRYVDHDESSNWADSDALGPYTDIYTEASMLTAISYAEYERPSATSATGMQDISPDWFLQRKMTLDRLLWRIGDQFTHDRQFRSGASSTFAGAEGILNADGWSTVGTGGGNLGWSNAELIGGSTYVLSRFRTEIDNVDACAVNRDLVYYGYLTASLGLEGRSVHTYENNDYAGDVEDTFYVFSTRTAQAGDSIDFKVGNFGDYTGTTVPGSSNSVGWEHRPDGTLATDIKQAAFVEKYNVASGFTYV